MTPPPFPSGEWVGYYLYEGKDARCPMHLTLNFANGKLSGAGIDNPGPFIIEGKYDPTSLAVSWQKNYSGKPGITYEGQWNNDEIGGVWFLQTAQKPMTGTFRLWPLPDNLYGDDILLSDMLTREIQRKG